MSIVTQAKLNEWHSHSITKEIFKVISDAVKEERETEVYKPGVSSSSYGIDCAYREGFLQGCKVIIETYGTLEYTHREDENE